MKKKFCSLLLIPIMTSLLHGETQQITENKNVNSSSSKTHYKAKDYSHLMGMKGFSNDALKLHFKLYQGYVTNTNLILNTLEQYSDEGKEKTPQYAELKRRLGWEFNGIRLHEYYFENLGGMGSHLDTNDALMHALEQNFGNYESWKNDFVATGAMRGIGWAVLYYDSLEKKLINTWINEHDVGHLAGGTPLLIMDVFEHAYLPDYGIDRAKYIDAFFNNIDWGIVSRRFSEIKAK